MDDTEIMAAKAAGLEKAEKDIDIDKDDDETLVQKILLRYSETEPAYKKRVREAKEDMAIFEGKLETDSIAEKAKNVKSTAIVNRAFFIIRNLVGMNTDNIPKIQMIPSRDTKPSQLRAAKIKDAIEYAMIRRGFLDQITNVLFDTNIKADAFGHWFWNYEQNDVDFIYIPLEEMRFSPDTTDLQTGEYLFWTPEQNRNYIKRMYPDYYEDVQFYSSTLEDTEPKQGGRGNVTKIIHYWENDIHVVLLRAKADGKNVTSVTNPYIVAKKQRNPYYEYRDPLTQAKEFVADNFPEQHQEAQALEANGQGSYKEILGADPQIGAAVSKLKPITNFLNEPRKPFVHFPSLKVGKTLYSKRIMRQIASTLIEYNEKKRQTNENIKNCNIKILADSNCMSEEQAKKITNAPFQVVLADFQENRTPLQYIQPVFQELQGVLATMEHDERYFDDVFGHHEISRGNGKSNTLGQDQMNAESDRTPVRMQTRALENSIKEVVEGWIQLIKMFYTQKHWIKKLGESDGENMQQIINTDVETGVEPIIIPQSMMKIDRASVAMQLWAQKATDPLTFFRDLDLDNPEERANRLINFQTMGLISEKDPEKMAADMQSQANSPGGGTQNPIEQADQENEAFQMGEGASIPPTPPEMVDRDHVSLHFSFANDKKKKLEQTDKDMLLAHAETDKATLASLIQQGALKPDGTRPNAGPAQAQGEEKGEKPPKKGQ